MSLSPLEKKIKSEIISVAKNLAIKNRSESIVTQGNDLSGVAPGLCLQVVQKGRLKVDLQLGQTFRFYDLASLTKILFTVPAFMQLADEKRFRLKDRISDALDWWPHKQTQLGQVLSHSAGLPWWAPYYKKLLAKKIIKVTGGKFSGDPVQIREFVRRDLARTKLSRSRKAVYSDLDFILLGFVLEELHDALLLDVWHQLAWVDKTHLHFSVGNKPLYMRALYAPTEKCPWRKKTLQGEVHDDNTWAFGGVSTHAGLFGTIDDVSTYGLMLRKGYMAKPSRVFKTASNAFSARSKYLSDFIATPKTLREFSRRAIPAARGDWASGFMMPTRGAASCGRYFSAQSFGHTGFTGTSFWFDPRRDLFVSLLSNRVHPTRDNRLFLQLRPLIHDIVCENLI